MTPEERRRTAATVIAKARDDHYAAIPPGAAAFDYHIAAGDKLAEQCLQNACYVVANPGHMNSPVGRPDLTAKYEARWLALWAELAPELEKYRARCKARKYTGWSNASTEPIRYAGWENA